MRTFSALVCLLLMTTSLFAQEKTVTGTVTDSTNEPLIGASVVIQGTSNGTITDIDGKYSITASPDNVLEFSYVGMVKQDVKVGSQHVINVQLKEDSQMLAETVVIGYGSAKKRDLTGSITNIKGAEIANKPSTNPLSSLQGKVAGVQIINSGQAGSDPEIRVRGTNSINGYKPLYIVDGLFNDNINFLNPEDIESMEVLKDPSSLAIFGVRGANGVIIITTKKAKDHKVLEAVALFHAAQLFRGGAHGLDDDGDGALLRVIVVDRYGDSLAVLIHAQDDELARLGLLGDQGCLDLIQGDGGTEGLFSHDTIHSVPSFPNDRILVFAAMYPSTRHIVYTLTQPPKAVNPFLRGFCEKNNKLSSAPSGRSIILYKG